MLKFRQTHNLIPLILFAGLCLTATQAISSAKPLITQKTNNAESIELVDHTRPEATRENDQGRLNDNTQLDHLQLLLKRPAKLEAQLKLFIASLQNKDSPSYHQWLTAKQFGQNYGASRDDIEVIKS